MSFFSKLKEKASASIKAAEKYIGGDEKVEEEEQPPPNFKVKTKAQGQNPTKDLSKSVDLLGISEEERKRKKIQDDPLAEMVKQAAEEHKLKIEKEDQNKGGNQNLNELQKLKIILRDKMKEYDDLLDETTKRDTEYQKLLQENDDKIKNLNDQNNNMQQEMKSITNQNQENIKIIEKLKEGLLALESQNNDLTKTIENFQSQETQSTNETLQDEAKIDLKLIKDYLSDGSVESENIK